MISSRQLPNALTVFRIILIPFLIASLFLEGKLYHWVASILFLIAGITDYFDGYLARTLKAHSSFGQLMDPIADKLIVATAIIMLVYSGDIGTWGIIPALAIISREIMVSGLREFLATTHVSVPVSALAKIKTVIQMLAIGLLLWGTEGPNIDEVQFYSDVHFTQLVGRILLWVAALLTLITGFAYFKAGFAHIRDKQ
jgi:CDP-diacylglycerol--glycerol-3-phosphate 3-phosphatidyltransferase